MKSYIFTCRTCETVMIIETKLPDNKIHMVPPCPCGVSRMDKISPVDEMYGRESRVYGGWDA